MNASAKTWEYRGRVIEEDYYGSDGRLRKTRTGYLIRRLGTRADHYEPGSFPTLAEAKKEIDKMTPTLIRVPAKFFNDHEERGCEPYCTPVKQTSRFVWLRPDDEGLDELLDDARHYAEPDQFGDWGRENSGIVRSAAATVLAIQAARKAVQA